MKQFKIFKSPAGEVQVVKQGFSWPAFFFNVTWAMFAKMWLIVICVLFFFIILGITIVITTGSVVTETGGALINFASSIIFGFYGNSWREKNLLSRGFDLKDTVTAANKDGAIALYLKSACSNKDSIIVDSIQRIELESEAPGFFIRLAAQIYDTFLLAIVLILANSLLYLFTTDELIRDNQLFHRIYLGSISFLFYGWFWTHGGQTFGLRAWKIKVLTLNKKPITWKHALLRFLTAIISFSCFGLGFIWVLMNRHKHSWHDYLSKTAVFYTDQNNT
jgi:uncharacterized RDD family membrane protein YckC